jgi:hypothetical protein
MAERMIWPDLEASLTDKREEWLKGYFLAGYPFRTVSDEAVISGIIWRHMHRMRIEVFRCTSCGNVMIQTAPGSNNFISFSAAE